MLAPAWRSAGAMDMAGGEGGWLAPRQPGALPPRGSGPTACGISAFAFQVTQQL
jgi:hypothetical protein